MLKLTLAGRSRRSSETARLIELVCENVRATDEKSRLGRFTLALLLVDTPEMGGRCAMDRLEYLAIRAGLHVDMDLRVYDTDAFHSDSHRGGSNRDDSDGGTGSGAPYCEPVREGPRPRLPEVVASATATAALPTVHRRTQPVEFTAATATGSVLAKRLIDVVGATVGLVFALPILLVAALAIRLTSRGPAIFAQVREGRSGRPFTIFKLRTMYIDAESQQAALRVLSERDGPAFKIKDDPRVTPVGRFLRATCIDELPQFVNVLLGDMSLVGPRPLPWAESRACAPWQRRRLDVRPGLTCQWQIQKQQVKTFDQWMRMDIAYIDRRGLWTDLRLLARTVTVPLTGRGSD